MNNPSQPNIKLVNAPDYRETYANSVQVRVNVWDFFLVFGTLQQQTESQVEVKNFQGIYLSPQQAKALMSILQQNVSGYESTFGDIERRRGYPTVLLFALFFAVLLALHAPLLRLPYFWDEAGYYVPAARDLLLHGTLIPYSPPSNAHPPLVMAWLALAWRVAG